jgi:hypothetical protein
MDEALHLMRRETPRPACLSRTAVTLLKDTLAKGVVQRFATLGWPDTRHLRAEQVASGRLWQRTPLAARTLSFSPSTLEFLMWLTANDVREARTKLEVDSSALTFGDRAFMVLAVAILAEEQLGRTLAGLTREVLFQQDDLVRLFRPEAFFDIHTPIVVSFDYWVASDRSWVLEALQPLLAVHWLEGEENKRRLTDRIQLIKTGTSQHRVLSSYLDALEAAGRRDLARFLLVAGGKLLLRPHAARDWFANLDQHGLRLAEREEAYRAALAVLGEFARLARWRHEAGLIAYYDEGYAASQLFKDDWDALRGEEICAAAADLVRHYTTLQRWETTH